jgi:hypothetical protein
MAYATSICTANIGTLSSIYLTPSTRHCVYKENFRSPVYSRSSQGCCSRRRDLLRIQSWRQSARLADSKHFAPSVSQLPGTSIVVHSVATTGNIDCSTFFWNHCSTLTRRRTSLYTESRNQIEIERQVYVMRTVLRAEINHFALCFPDDILIFSGMFKEHVYHFTPSELPISGYTRKYKFHLNEWKFLGIKVAQQKS